MRMPVLFIVILLLASCGGPRSPQISRQQALAWREPMTVRIDRIWDLMRDRVEADPELSHLVEVTILDGPKDLIGKEFALPYDAYACGTEREPYKVPPRVGSTQVLMPMEWVAGDIRRRR